MVTGTFHEVLCKFAEQNNLDHNAISKEIGARSGLSQRKTISKSYRWGLWLSGRSLKTVEDLHQDLQTMGYQLTITPIDEKQT